jgi:hypothetical protein
MEKCPLANSTPPLSQTRTTLAQSGRLVERVANAISEGDEPDKWHPEARDAIREVAAWLRENDSECQMGGDAAATAELLEQEADRG